MRYCPQCSTVSPLPQAPVECKGFRLGFFEWLSVSLLVWCWLIPGVLLFALYYSKKVWTCPCCGKANRLKAG